jgi:hypothetical protein
MARVPVTPRSPSYDRDRRDVQADIERLDRRQRELEQVPFVRVSPYPVHLWPTGTLWLDTLTIGPLASHPLKVLLEGGTWDTVAYMVPA